MIVNHKTSSIIIVLALFLYACRESFTPPRAATDTHYLVVEGFINAGGGPTTFSLSRTRSIRDTGDVSVTPPIYVSGAEVVVKDDQGNSYHLPDLGSGQYGGISLPIDNQRKYKLYIKTAQNIEYASSFVSVTSAPVIDSMYWKLEKDGVHVYFDSYNTDNVTRYYRWSFSETWEFHTTLISEYKYDPYKVTVEPRRPNEQVHICWQSDKSTDILVGNTAKLANNSLSRARLGFIPTDNEKLSVLYSTKMELFSLSEAGFEFWQRMKKNTEEMGTIFAPQPSTIRGNVHCITHPNEPVIGYVGANAMASKRIFINHNQLSAGWGNLRQCETDTISTKKSSLIKHLGSGGMIPLYPLLGPPGGLLITYRSCADCSVRGTTIKPPFWP